MRVLIIVTHLLGTGHLARALVLARGFASEGDEVIVASGGMPVSQLSSEGVTLLQLPALRSNGTDFAQLLDADARPASDALFAARQQALTDVIASFAPQIVITELFPFGRRGLKGEFTASLEAAESLEQPPRIFASVRDILAPPSKPRKAAFADDMIASFYDGILVHADPEVITLDASWPVSDAMRSKLRYTGFVASPLPEYGDGRDGTGEILVSAGGGSVGGALYRAALSVAATDTRTWRLLIGGHDAAERIADLRCTASPNVIVEPARPDFRALIRRCAASVSLTGYNTAMDILQAGTPAVMVAFDDGNEVEQSLRADALSTLPQLETLALSDVTAPTLRAALDRALSDLEQRTTDFDMDGGTQSRVVCLAGARG